MVPFQTFRGPIFFKPVTGQELFFGRFLQQTSSNSAKRNSRGGGGNPGSYVPSGPFLSGTLALKGIIEHLHLINRDGKLILIIYILLRFYILLGVKKLQYAQKN